MLKGSSTGLGREDFDHRAGLVMACAKAKLRAFSKPRFCHENMDTLDNTEWDVLIVGTGLQQSLLAL